jgi:tRNA(fMet)-specific endonuclease VapC
LNTEQQRVQDPITTGLPWSSSLPPFEIIPYDDIAAKEYGIVRVSLERKGTPIGSMDMLIAAHAVSLDCTLVTNNEREFNRVPSLKIENWVK